MRTVTGPGFRGEVSSVSVNGRAIAGAPKVRVFHKVEFYGGDLTPRVRWECPRCRHRNDTRLQPPVRAREPVVCRKCKRPDVVRAMPKGEP